MTKQKLFTILKYAFGIWGASFVLEFLDLSQASANQLQNLLTYNFWGKLSGLFMVYLLGAYVLVYFTSKNKAEVSEE